MNTPVTREILHNYLRCKYKGYLKLRGESGTKTDYEILIRELSEKFKLKAVNKIRNSYNDDHILQGVNITQSLLKQGTDTIVDAVIEDDIFSLHLDGLKKVSGPSQLGPMIDVLMCDCKT